MEGSSGVLYDQIMIINKTSGLSTSKVSKRKNKHCALGTDRGAPSSWPKPAINLAEFVPLGVFMVYIQRRFNTF